ncbi:hypothetical protein NIES4106_61390 (plasmid) [Fischerella sp. NIES-4106]|nr:hypothetical protein NIES4106_61390 [Fischerella sp. NIES-4106]
MSQKLATFKIDEEKWKAFQEAAAVDGASASSLLKDFIDWYMAGNRLEKPDVSTPGVDQRIEERFALLREELHQQIEQLRGELVA